MALLSPLALTQTLPFLPLAQGDIDYQTERRDEPGLILGLLNDPSTTVILVRDGLVAVPRGQGVLAARESVSMRLASLPGSYAAEALAGAPEAVAMFLGGYPGRRNAHVVAIDLTRVPMGAPSVVPDAHGIGADDAFGNAAQPNSTNGRVPLFARTAERFDWVDLRGFVPHASAREAGQATTAVALSLWHATQRHCPTCGAPVQTAMAGWAQRCTNPQDGQRLLFPRVEPAVIVAVVDSQDRLLLQHNRAWNDPTLYSVSAGFVEAGENLEHACRRETKEEVGIDLGEVRYLGSQPWPFPASLMVAFKAYALNTDIRTDGQETVDARWVSRDEYTEGDALERVGIRKGMTMSDDYQMDGFSPMDDDRTVAMPPVGDASPMTMGEDAIVLPGDEEKPRNTKLPWIITLSVIGALLVLAVAGLFTARWYFSDKAAPGVTLGQISVVGQDRDRLTDTVTRAIGDSTLTVADPDGQEIKASLEELGVSVDVDATVDALLNAKVDGDATGVRALLSDFARLNPFSKAEIGLSAEYDEYTANTFLTDRFVADDQQAVPSSIAYDAGSQAFTVTEGKVGRAPQLDAVNKAVANAIKTPGMGADVKIDYSDVDMPIGVDAANQAAADANQRLNNKIVLTNDRDRNFELSNDTVASWIKPTGDVQNGTITLSYDEQAIKDYLAAELPKQLNQEKVGQTDIIDDAGNVLLTRVDGVDGVAVKNTDTTAAKVLEALEAGNGGLITAEFDVTPFETKQEKATMRIVVDKSSQTATVYNNNQLVRTFPVCTGTPGAFGETDNGTFYIYLKYAVQDMRGYNEDGSKYLSPGVKWVGYFNGGEGFHTADWNYYGIQVGDPAHYGSHGCVNMYEADAKWIYDNCPEGTIVQVVGSTPSGPVR